MLRPGRGVPASSPPPEDDGKGLTGGPAVILARIAAVLESISSPAAVVDSTGVVVAVNQAWSDLADAEPDEDDYTRACGAVHPTDVARIRAGVTAVLSGDELAFEHTYYRSERYGGAGTVHVTPIAGTAEAVALIVHTSPTDEQRGQSDGGEFRLRNVFDGAGMAIAVVDLKGRAVDVNPALCELLGAAEEDLIGQELPALADSELPAVIRGERDAVRHECRLMRPDRQPQFIRVTTSGVHDELGRLRYLISVLEDMTGTEETADARPAAGA